MVLHAMALVEEKQHWRTAHWDSHLPACVGKNFGLHGCQQQSHCSQTGVKMDRQNCQQVAGQVLIAAIGQADFCGQELLQRCQWGDGGGGENQVVSLREHCHSGLLWSPGFWFFFQIES